MNRPPIPARTHRRTVDSAPLGIDDPPLKKGKTTIMGGPHASVDQGVFLDSGHFDYVLKGEAEHTLPQLVRAIEGKDDNALEEIAGLASMRDGELWVDNPAPPGA